MWTIAKKHFLEKKPNVMFMVIDPLLFKQMMTFMISYMYIRSVSWFEKKRDDVVRFCDEVAFYLFNLVNLHKVIKI